MVNTIVNLIYNRQKQDNNSLPCNSDKEIRYAYALSIVGFPLQ